MRDIDNWLSFCHLHLLETASKEQEAEDRISCECSSLISHELNKKTFEGE